MSGKERGDHAVRRRAAERKLARRPPPCCPGCPGWCVSESGLRGLEVQRCDDCWCQVPNHLRLLDEEAAALPEAIAALAAVCAVAEEEDS